MKVAFPTKIENELQSKYNAQDRLIDSFLCVYHFMFLKESTVEKQVHLTKHAGKMF